MYSIRDLPAAIAFEIALFPKNVPLPSPKTSARILGGTIHFLHLCINASHESDHSWDSLSRNQNDAWFDWVGSLYVLFLCLLILHYRLRRSRFYSCHFLS